MHQKIRCFIGMAVISGLLAACGGGGGGSTGLKYDGLTSQADLDTANSQEFLEVMLDGSEGGDAFTSSSSTGSGTSSSDLDLVVLARALKDSTDHLAAGSVSGGPITSDVQSRSNSEEGPCGGFLNYSISFDDQTGAFNGTLNYRGFCAEGVVIDGSVRFSGTLDLTDLSLLRFDLVVDLLRVSDGSETFELSGALSIDVSNPDLGIVDYDVNVRVNNKIFRLASFRVQIDESVFPAAITIEGRVFHPDHGYVDVTTPDPINESFDGTPEAGVVVFTGANGSSATVTFTGANTYIIEVDNDGVVGVDATLICTWSPDECLPM